MIYKGKCDCGYELSIETSEKLKPKDLKTLCWKCLKKKKENIIILNEV